MGPEPVYEQAIMINVTAVNATEATDVSLLHKPVFTYLTEGVILTAVSSVGLVGNVMSIFVLMRVAVQEAERHKANVMMTADPKKNQNKRRHRQIWTLLGAPLHFMFRHYISSLICSLSDYGWLRAKSALAPLVGMHT